MTDGVPPTCPQAEFARLLGYRRSYVTALKAAGRLVLADDGKVRVAESIARIEATRDPSKAAVAERHAAARSGQGVPAAACAPAPEPGAALDDADAETLTRGYQYWRERRERAAALSAEREHAEAEGKLLRTADVVAACGGACATARGALEALADTLGPQLAAETDEARCRALIAEAVELQLAELSRRLGALGVQP